MIRVNFYNIDKTNLGEFFRLKAFEKAENSKIEKYLIQNHQDASLIYDNNFVAALHALYEGLCERSLIGLPSSIRGYYEFDICYTKRLRKGDDPLRLFYKKINTGCRSGSIIDMGNYVVCNKTLNQQGFVIPLDKSMIVDVGYMLSGEGTPIPKVGDGIYVIEDDYKYQSNRKLGGEHGFLATCYPGYEFSELRKYMKDNPKELLYTPRPTLDCLWAAQCVLGAFNTTIYKGSNAFIEVPMYEKYVVYEKVLCDSGDSIYEDYEETDQKGYSKSNDKIIHERGPIGPQTCRSNSISELLVRVTSPCIGGQFSPDQYDRNGYSVSDAYSHYFKESKLSGKEFAPIFLREVDSEEGSRDDKEKEKYLKDLIHLRINGNERYLKRVCGAAYTPKRPDDPYSSTDSSTKKEDSVLISNSLTTICHIKNIDKSKINESTLQSLNNCTFDLPDDELLEKYAHRIRVVLRTKFTSSIIGEHNDGMQNLIEEEVYNFNREGVIDALKRVFLKVVDRISTFKFLEPYKNVSKYDFWHVDYQPVDPIRGTWYAVYKKRRLRSNEPTAYGELDMSDPENPKWIPGVDIEVLEFDYMMLIVGGDFLGDSFVGNSFTYQTFSSYYLGVETLEKEEKMYIAGKERTFNLYTCKIPERVFDIDLATGFLTKSANGYEQTCITHTTTISPNFTILIDWNWKALPSHAEWVEDVDPNPEEEDEEQT